MQMRSIASRTGAVRDASGQALGLHPLRGGPGRRAAAHLLTRDEARRIAANSPRWAAVFITPPWGVLRGIHWIGEFVQTIDDDKTLTAKVGTAPKQAQGTSRRCGGTQSRRAPHRVAVTRLIQINARSLRSTNLASLGKRRR